MNDGLPSMVYLVSAVCFIGSLGGLSRQETARRGVLLGAFGIALAVGATLFSKDVEGVGLIVPSIVVGAIIGAILGARVVMTAMPQLVAMLHSFVGLAAILVGISAYLNPHAMTDAERALCLVNVGDLMPDARLPDHEGVDQSLSTLRGSRATVVLFWTGGSPIAAIKAQAVLEDLRADVAEQYADQGIHVIAINEHDTPETVGQLREDSAATFPMLLDPQGAYFQTVAKERLPRLYVLDADGRILWLDFGYSETTHDTLQRVLRYLAAQ